MPSLLAKRYAQALYSLADEAGQLTVVHSDVVIILGAIHDSEDFRHFLRNPVISSQVRQKIITEIFKEKLQAMTKNFLMFLSEKRRLPFLKEILDSFEGLFRSSQNILKAQLISPFPLEHKELERIKNRLSDKFQKDVEPELKIDPSLIGGFKLQIEDKVYDFSIKTQLENFRKKIIHQ